MSKCAHALHSRDTCFDFHELLDGFKLTFKGTLYIRWVTVPPLTDTADAMFPLTPRGTWKLLCLSVCMYVSVSKYVGTHLVTLQLAFLPIFVTPEMTE